VDKKTRFGDLEVDLIIGGETPLVTINDRAAGMVKIRKAKSKEADEVSKIIVLALEDWMPYIHTITSDNGTEFARHQYIAENLGIDYYFCRPYHSWERGANENLNGLIRQYFPKGMDFKNITEEQIQDVEDILNNRPRKRFNYQTPIQKMEEILFNNKVAFLT
ncbi:MAG: IS30 family transposase, partial [Mangrovibacterium sp.]